MTRLVIAALLLASMLTVANGHLFTVFWNTRNNYTDWVSDKQFIVGDWIGFLFDKDQYSVLEVNQTNYEKCIESDFITQISKTGHDVFHLTEARPYYFISGLGECYNGMKLSINVENALSPGPTPHKNSSPVANSLSGLVMFLSWAFSMIFIYV